MTKLRYQVFVSSGVDNILNYHPHPQSIYLPYKSIRGTHLSNKQAPTSTPVCL